MSKRAPMVSYRLQVGYARASHFCDAETCEFPSLSVLPFFLLILCRAASSAAYSHTGDLEWEVESTSDTFQCGLVGSFTSPGIGTRKKGPTAFSVSSERHWQRRVNVIAKVPNSKSPAVGVEPSIVRSPVEALTHSATAPP